MPRNKTISPESRKPLTANSAFCVHVEGWIFQRLSTHNSEIWIAINDHTITRSEKDMLGELREGLATLARDWEDAQHLSVFAKKARAWVEDESR